MTKLFKLPDNKAHNHREDPELLSLIRLLRYGTVNHAINQAPILNQTAIAHALGVTRDRVRVLLDQSKRERESMSPDGERSRKRNKLTVQHVQYLTADETLDDWAHLSLKERAIMFHR